MKNKMKKLSLAIITIITLNACSAMNYKNQIPGEPSYGAMTGYAKALKSKELLKINIQPISFEKVDAYSQAIAQRVIKDLESSEFVINRAGRDLVLIIPKHIILSSDFSINPGQSVTLNKLTKILRDFDETLIEVTGHTDSKGNADTNQKISIIRAEAVAKDLMNRGVEGQRLFINGLGETRWIAMNTTPEGRATNNRIEIRITPSIYIK